MTDLQALITGALMGALMQQQYIDVSVQPMMDVNGNYEPFFLVTSNKSGERLVVKVGPQE